MNNFKRIIISFLILKLLVCNNLNAQGLIDHKLDVGFSIGMAYGMEGDRFASDDFIAPSLLNHMKSGYTGEVFMNLKALAFMGVYAGVTATRFSEWEGPEDNNIYKGSSCQFRDFKPGISFFTPFKNSGFFNKANVNLSIGPSFSKCTIDFGEGIQGELKTETGSIGGFAIVGINYSLSQNSYLTLSYAFNHLKNSSDVSIQDSYQYHSINVGIGLQLFKNKKYLYE